MELTIDEGAQKLGCINPKRIYEKMDELVTVLRVKSQRMSNNIVNMSSKMNMASFFPNYQRSVEVSSCNLFQQYNLKCTPKLYSYTGTLV